MSRSKVMGEILRVLERYETFLISSHINPDGDAIGSQLAFYSFLSHFGKKVSVVSSDPVPLAYSFLPNFSVFCVKPMSNAGFGPVSEDGCDWENIEVAIVLDCGNLDRIGKELAARIRPEQALINIDHHLSNNYFGTHNLVDTDACATAELVFNLMEYGGIEIDRDWAVCLYTAILTDTGAFRFSNTTAEAHRIAAQLIDRGVRPDRVAELVYETIPYQRAKLFGMALETLQLSFDGKIAWMLVTNEMHRRTETGSADTEGLIDYVRSLKGIETAILFRETENGDIKVSLRSKDDLYSVDRIAAMFGGGGHRTAAGCVISEPLDKATDMILEAVRSGINSG